MHVLAVLFVVLVLTLALGLIASLASAYRGKIVAALAGRSVLAASLKETGAVVVKPLRARSRGSVSRFRGIAANDGGCALPLAA